MPFDLTAKAVYENEVGKNGETKNRREVGFRLAVTSFPRHQRQFDRDACPLSRRAFHGRVAAKQSRPLLDASQAETVPFEIAGSKTYPPVLNLDPKVIAMLHHFNFDVLALAMCAGVR